MNANAVGLVGAGIFAIVMFVLVFSLLLIDYFRKKRILKKIRDGGRTIKIQELYYPPSKDGEEE